MSAFTGRKPAFDRLIAALEAEGVTAFELLARSLALEAPDSAAEANAAERGAAEAEGEAFDEDVLQTPMQASEDELEAVIDGGSRNCALCLYAQTSGVKPWTPWTSS